MLLLAAVTSLYAQDMLPVEDLEKDGAVNAIHQGLDDKFSVRGGTVTGDSFFTEPVSNSGTLSQTGAATFTSSVTIQTDGREVLIGTSTTSGVYSIKVETDGDVLFSPKIHNSTCAAQIPTASFTNTTFAAGILGSTVTFTTAGGDVFITANIICDVNVTGGNVLFSFLQDGAVVSPLSTTKGACIYQARAAGAVGVCPIAWIIKSVAAGSHSYTLTGRVTGDTGSIQTTSNFSNQFCATELR